MKQLRTLKTADSEIRSMCKTLLEVLPYAILLSKLAGDKNLSLIKETSDEKFQIKVSENKLEIMLNNGAPDTAKKTPKGMGKNL